MTRDDVTRLYKEQQLAEARYKLTAEYREYLRLRDIWLIANGEVEAQEIIDRWQAEQAGRVQA